MCKLRPGEWLACASSGCCRLSCSSGLKDVFNRRAAGGGLAAALTAVPGSSTVVLGGVVAYANAVKHELLAVSTSGLQHHGAVTAGRQGHGRRGWGTVLGRTGAWR